MEYENSNEIELSNLLAKTSADVSRVGSDREGFEYEGSEQDGSEQEGSEQDEYQGAWSPQSFGPRFTWIQIAIFCNVFLSGFDGTVIASIYPIIGSDFNAADTISWLTTSYLLTATALQPLYGRFSDILGRRTCFFIATISFLLGCLGCGLAPNLIFLNLMRGFMGLGGGGLITMATIINSDIIPLRYRGMYHAVQNGVLGSGAISGALLGGFIADKVGWRWCFLCQIPVSLSGLIIGYFAIIYPPPAGSDAQEDGWNVENVSSWAKIDIIGAALLVSGLSAQLAGLSLGGNWYPWSDTRVIICFITSAIILTAFVWVEIRTTALPVMPMFMLKGWPVISNMISNVLVGMSSYAFLFMIPLFFQVVLLESAAKAGYRLTIAALSTPIGSLIAGFVMSRWGMLSHLVRLGCILIMLGNGLIASLQYNDSNWKYVVYLVPANVGQGIVYPSILFTSIANFEHSQQAVSTSTVYLFRSMGTVWGVAASSTIIQSILSSRLPGALLGVPDKEKIILEIRHSVTVLGNLDPEIQEIARRVYFEALRYAFLASTGWATMALFAAFFARGQKLDRR